MKKKNGLCARCQVEPRHASAAGKIYSYCHACKQEMDRAMKKTQAKKAKTPDKNRDPLRMALISLAHENANLRLAIRRAIKEGEISFIEDALEK